MDSTSRNIVALAGGVGGAKLAFGLAQIVPAKQLTIIVNTADDFQHLGLHLSPDLDTVMYTLAGAADPTTGWGVKDDSRNMLAAMARYGGPTWFQLGDRDLATQLLRTKWLREGYPLTWVTNELCRRLDVRCSVLPMTDQPVQTVVRSGEDELAFQDYFVRKRCEPVISSIRFAEIEQAQPTQEVINALRQADVIIFCPSNPLLSLDPILAVPNLRRIIAASRAPKIGVSPIVKGAALKGPAAKIMTELGLEVSPVGVANHLRDVLTGFVIDSEDEIYGEALTAMGLQTLVTTTIMKDDKARIALASEVLKFSEIFAP